MKRIQCPNCGVVLDVRNSKNEAVKLITCPQCKVTLRVKFSNPTPQNPLDAHTFMGGSQDVSQDGETQLGGGTNNGETELHYKAHAGESQERHPYVRANGKDYKLNMGVNIVGRKASTSQATVQIATDDLYMSRQHAKIVVSRMADGKLKAVISNDHNKNISTIDGQDLLQDDAIILSDGDSIVMGQTTVIYKEL